MPSKVIIDNKDQTMEEEVDTVIEAKPVKVSVAAYFSRETLKKSSALTAMRFNMFDNMWL